MAYVMTSSDRINYTVSSNGNFNTLSTIRGFSFWLKVSSQTSSSIRRLLILSTTNTSFLDNRHEVFIGANNSFLSFVSQGPTGGPSGSSNTSTNSIQANVWQHVFGVLQNVAGNTISRTIYLNGVAGNTETTSIASTRSLNNIRLAPSLSGSDSIEIAEFALWYGGASNPIIADTIVGLSKGFIPSRFHTNILESYIPLLRDTNDRCYDYGASAAIIGSPTVSAHPDIYI